MAAVDRIDDAAALEQSRSVRATRRRLGARGRGSRLRPAATRASRSRRAAGGNPDTDELPDEQRPNGQAPLSGEAPARPAEPAEGVVADADGAAPMSRRRRTAFPRGERVRRRRSPDRRTRRKRRRPGVRRARRLGRAGRTSSWRRAQAACDGSSGWSRQARPRAEGGGRRAARGPGAAARDRRAARQAGAALQGRAVGPLRARAGAARGGRVEPLGQRSVQEDLCAKAEALRAWRT